MQAMPKHGSMLLYPTGVATVTSRANDAGDVARGAGSGPLPLEPRYSRRAMRSTTQWTLAERRANRKVVHPSHLDTVSPAARPDSHPQEMAWLSGGDSVDGLGNVVHVGCGHACHRDAAIACDVDVMLLLQLQDLIRGHAAKAKHANLIRDVIPILGRSHLDEGLLERNSHVDDAIRHDGALGAPLCTKCGVTQDLLHDASAGERW
mmetsp:Transcript_28254/g.86377  ORF Transcript_28254/g.86377 Transcript_28254/m.86377 type:complete len:206 (+) Transcript_28254:578-1195(+)